MIVSCVNIYAQGEVKLRGLGEGDGGEHRVASLGQEPAGGVFRRQDYEGVLGFFSFMRACVSLLSVYL